MSRRFPTPECSAVRIAADLRRSYGDASPAQAEALLEEAMRRGTLARVDLLRAICAVLRDDARVFSRSRLPYRRRTQTRTVVPDR